MDFAATENYTAVTDLAADIFSGETADGYQARFDRSGEAWDKSLWQVLTEAGLVGLCIDEACGGAGLGMDELAGLLEAQGRVLAPVPMLCNSVAAMTLQQFCEADWARALLSKLAAGRRICSIALDATRPVHAGGKLTGSIPDVPYARIADAALVAAQDERAGTVLVCVSVDRPGMTVEAQKNTSREPHDVLRFDGYRVDAEHVVATGPEACEWALQRMLTGLAALQLGVSTAALEQTVEYVGERNQFGRPISSFQAVTHRAADGYIDCEALRSVVWQAAWRLNEGLDATLEARSAKWWAAEAGHRIAHTAQHLHGGIGADREFPIHRYFLASKQIEFSLGGARAQLGDAGRILAQTSDTGVRL